MTLTKLISSYPLHRTVVAGMAFAAVTIAARLLPATDFATLTTAAFMAKFLQVCNLGATNGYFVSLYSSQGMLSQASKGADRVYLSFVLLQMLALGLIVLSAAAWLFPKYLIGAIAFIFLAPIYAVEPYLRSRRNFSFSLMPDLALSVALLGAVIIHLVHTEPWDVVGSYLVVIAVFSLIAVVLAMRKQMPSRGTASVGLRSYVQLMSLGTSVYLGSLLFLLASSMDRLILPLHGTNDEIALYFLGQQLAAGSVIFLTAINFVNTVKLGEARKQQVNISVDLIKKKLSIAALVGISSFVALVAGTMVLEYHFLPANFAGLTTVVLFLGLAQAFFFTSNAITPLAAYYHRQFPLTLAMAFFATALLANNLYAFEHNLGALWLAKGTALAFFMYAIFSIIFIISIVRKNSSKSV